MSRWPLRIRAFLLFQPWFWTKPLILVTNLVQLWLFSVRFSDDGNLGLSSLVIFLRTLPPFLPWAPTFLPQEWLLTLGYQWLPAINPNASLDSDCFPKGQKLHFNNFLHYDLFWTCTPEESQSVEKKYGWWFLHEFAHQIMVPQALLPFLLNVPGWNSSIVVIFWAPLDLGRSRKGRKYTFLFSRTKRPCLVSVKPPVNDLAGGPTRVKFCWLLIHHNGVLTTNTYEFWS